MSSMFDTNVYHKRRRNEFLSPSIMQFMKHMAVNEQQFHSHGQKLDEPIQHPDIKLTVSYRPSVASRFWYTLQWVDVDNKNHQVDAQDLDLLGWRAIQMHEDIAKEKLRFKYGTGKALQGIIHPDGVHCTSCGSRHYRNEEGQSWCSNIHCPY